MGYRDALFHKTTYFLIKRHKCMVAWHRRLSNQPLLQRIKKSLIKLTLFCIFSFSTEHAERFVSIKSYCTGLQVIIEM